MHGKRKISIEMQSLPQSLIACSGLLDPHLQGVIFEMAVPNGGRYLCLETTGKRHVVAMADVNELFSTLFVKKICSDFLGCFSANGRHES